MFYTKDIIIETANIVTNKKEVKIKAWAGIIHHVGLFARPGCAGTARVQFWIGGHQIYPMEPGTYFTPTEVPLRFIDELKIKTDENTIILKLWNVGAVYSHTITIELGILPVKFSLERKMEEMMALFRTSNYRIARALRKR